LEVQGRTVGRFRSVERAGLRVALVGWSWERTIPPAAVRNGVIVLVSAGGEPVRRWNCGLAEPDGETRMLAERIRVLARRQG
jgi:hypothetical protein